MLIPQPTPWFPCGHREIGDANNNVVQYTEANLGLICLAVNFHAKIMDAIHKIESMVTDPEILNVIKSATGRVGPANVAFMIETSPEGSNELNQVIGGELEAPVVQYTQSVDMAMSIIPEGWVCAFKPNGSQWMVELSNEAGRTVQAVHTTLPLAICLASMRARAPDTVSVTGPIVPEGTVTVSYAST